MLEEKLRRAKLVDTMLRGAACTPKPSDQGTVTSGDSTHEAETEVEERVAKAEAEAP